MELCENGNGSQLNSESNREIWKRWIPGGASDSLSLKTIESRRWIIWITYCHNNNTLAFCCALEPTYFLLFFFSSYNHWIYFNFTMYGLSSRLRRWVVNNFLGNTEPKINLPLSQTASELVEMKDKLRKLRVATVMATLNGIHQNGRSAEWSWCRTQV